MWKNGELEFTGPKISRIKAHLKEGGEIWIGTISKDARNIAVVVHGGLDHSRTTKDGCVLSAKPTGEGGPDVIRRLNLDQHVYLPRGGPDHLTILTVKFYKYIRKSNEVAPFVSEASIGIFQRVFDVVRGSPWAGLIIFYFTRMPVPASAKLPCIIFVVAAGSSIFGLGFLSPLWYVFRDGWILMRTILDVLTNSGGPTDVWYWAFLLSLIWPACALCKHVWIFVYPTTSHPPPELVASADSERTVPATPSVRSLATTHTASDSGSIRKGHQQAEQSLVCGADSFFLLKSLASPLSESECHGGNVQWCRIVPSDAREVNQGKTNQFDGQDWMQLCRDHLDQYEDWARSTKCHVRDCHQTQCAPVIGGSAFPFCKDHMPVEVSKTPVSSAPRIATSTTCPLENYGVNEPNVEKKKEETALSRVMKLQKSTMRRKPTPKRRASVGIGDSDARSLSGQSNNSPDRGNLLGKTRD